MSNAFNFKFSFGFTFNSRRELNFELEPRTCICCITFDVEPTYHKVNVCSLCVNELIITFGPRCNSPEGKIIVLERWQKDGSFDKKRKRIREQILGFVTGEVKRSS